MIFDFYCEELTEITIRCHHLETSYKKIADCFMDTKFITLKLNKILQLFPKLNKITITDGDVNRLIPCNMPFNRTIFGVIDKALNFVIDNGHPLKEIILTSTSNSKVADDLLTKLEQKLTQVDWKFSYITQSEVDDEEDDGEYLETEYKIYR